MPVPLFVRDLGLGGSYEPRTGNLSLGAGFMGAGIATVAVDQAGVPVRIKDADLPRVGKGLKAAADVIKGQVKRRRYDRREGARKLALIKAKNPTWRDLSGDLN